MKSWLSFYKPVDCFSKFAAPSCHKMQLPRNNYYYKMQDTEFDNFLELLVKISSKWIDIFIPQEYLIFNIDGIKKS